MPQPDVTEMIRALTQPIVHREPVTQPKDNGDGTFTLHTTGHVTKHPSLLSQLEQNPSTLERLEGTTGTFTSKPAANVEAIDTLADIDKEASDWVKSLGHDDAGDTAAVVLTLGGLLPAVERCGSQPKKHQECCNWHAIERGIRGWYVRARIVTGWEEAPWAPNNTCPLCGARGKLRIRRDELIASCKNCRETWSPDEIGILAEHLRAENGESDEQDYANGEA